MKKLIQNVICTCVLILLISALLTGCFPSAESKPNLSSSDTSETESSEAVSNDSVNEFPDRIEDSEIEKLSINAKVIVPEAFRIDQTVSIASAIPKIWDKERIVSEFSDGRQLAEEFSAENTGPDDLVYVYTYDDDSSLTFHLGKVYYSTQASREYDYSYYFDYYSCYKDENAFEEMFGTEAISGIEKSDAEDAANRVISMFGLEDAFGDPKIYSMDSACINRIQEKEDVRDKHGEEVAKWDSQQDAYLLIYPVLYQSIPSPCISSATGENEILTSSKAYFVYGRNGLIEFVLFGVFDVVNTIQEACVCSPLDAIQKCKSSFENIIMDHQIELSSVKLTYIIRQELESVGAWRIEPVWLIDGVSQETNRKNGNDTATLRNYTSIISAVSGETIPLKSIGG